MSTAGQLWQTGFVNVDKWKWTFRMYSKEQRIQLWLAVLRNDPQATELDLSECEIGDANAQVLAGHLSSNTHLTWLSLGFNRLTDDSVQWIAQALAYHLTLKKLSLPGNKGITDTSCPALAELLRTVPTLESLDLSATSITNVGVKTLCLALIAHPFIKMLWLTHCMYITNPSCSALADLLRTVPTLKRLYLSDTRIAAKGQAILAAALGRTELRGLDIDVTEEERLRNHGRWTEHKHCCAAVGFRRNVAELVRVLDKILAWDDLERVIKGWCIARRRMWWGR